MFLQTQRVYASWARCTLKHPEGYRHLPEGRTALAAGTEGSPAWRGRCPQGTVGQWQPPGRPGSGPGHPSTGRHQQVLTGLKAHGSATGPWVFPDLTLPTC